MSMIVLEAFGLRPSASRWLPDGPSRTGHPGNNPAAVPASLVLTGGCRSEVWPGPVARCAKGVDAAVPGYDSWSGRGMRRAPLTVGSDRSTPADTQAFALSRVRVFVRCLETYDADSGGPAGATPLTKIGARCPFSSATAYLACRKKLTAR